MLVYYLLVCILYVNSQVLPFSAFRAKLFELQSLFSFDALEASLFIKHTSSSTSVYQMPDGCSIFIESSPPITNIYDLKVIIYELNSMLPVAVITEDLTTSYTRYEDINDIHGHGFNHSMPFHWMVHNPDCRVPTQHMALEDSTSSMWNVMTAIGTLNSWCPRSFLIYQLEIRNGWTIESTELVSHDHGESIDSVVDLLAAHVMASHQTVWSSLKALLTHNDITDTLHIHVDTQHSDSTLLIYLPERDEARILPNRCVITTDQSYSISILSRTPLILAIRPPLNNRFHLQCPIRPSLPRFASTPVGPALGLRLGPVILTPVLNDTVVDLSFSRTVLVPVPLPDDSMLYNALLLPFAVLSGLYILQHIVLFKRPLDQVKKHS
eukprot:gnl/Dysnectes_brevis/4894_a6798_513.p1 GENE.gnl/Dysnectes_brevis/4894_a6798_513~~gnl/Dysnectes_brevis/4894_a6798_513.p1  ORF type:complete len:381 (-),score=26.02 gnl/Dysnectes_brevis/4894_a6798_513:32-1174(-)